MGHILVVDDNRDILETVSTALRFDGFDVAVASSGEQALNRIHAEQPDAVILDVTMPEMDGLTLCRMLRADERYITLPILFLTARGETDDVVDGLDAGGDDYVIKPFKLAELRARVRALLRRRAGGDIDDENGEILTVGGVVLDSTLVQATVSGRVIQLTATEHRLLRYMMEHANQPLSPQRLLEDVWEYPPHTGDPDLVRAHVRNLRAKIEEDSRNPEYIQTVHGVGYTIKS